MATGSKGKKSGTKNKTVNNNDSLRNEVILLLVLAFCIVLFLSYFFNVGRFGIHVKAFMFGIFGMISYIVPFTIFYSAAFYISNKGKAVVGFKIGAAVTLVITLCSFASLIFTPDIMNSEVRTFYESCKSRHTSGGVIGSVFDWVLLKCIGKAGTWVALIALFIIAIVLLTEKSFFGGVKKSSETIYNSARDDAIRRKERRIEREEARRHEYELQAEEKTLRMDKRVSGVMLDTTLKDRSSKKDDIHEITENTQGSDTNGLKNKHSINFVENTEFEDNYVEDIFPEKKNKIKDENVTEIKPQTSQTSVSTKKAKPVKSEQTDKKEVIKPVNYTKKITAEGYAFPPFELLEKGKETSGDSSAVLNETAAKLQETLRTFGVNVTLTDISQGPTVTRYELEPEPGVKVSKIVGLADDIKLRMAATDIRIEAPIPGKAAVGIEIPNANNATVMFRDLIETDTFINASSKISFAVGKDLGGQVVVADIGKMPHMLIAGATGSGKSVCINTLIMSILYKATPDEVKLIMIDPKVVELSVYNGIPHLMVPVVTDPKKAAAALAWGVSEMTDRYNKFAELNVRDLKGYNKKVETLVNDESSEEDKAKYRKMPQIVIIVDELADLMMVAPGDVEDSICRLAQLARAAGIHLIIATQRPSVDVITGLIKANMPSRVAFSVSSGVDSRTILDMNGAEKLLGKGDMLFYPQGYPKPARIQGAFVSDSEVSAVVDFLKDNNKEKVSAQDSEELQQKVFSAQTVSLQGESSSDSERDELYVLAGNFVIETQKASIGNLQRKFKIGFNRAARIMDQLAEDEVVSESEGTKPRQVLMSQEEFESFVEECV